MNNCLLSAMVLFFGLRNIDAADVPSCSDLSENSCFRGKSKCMLYAESCKQSAAVGQQVCLDCSTCRNKSGSVDWWYRRESKNFNKTVLISFGERSRIDGEKVFFIADDKTSLIVDNIRYNDAGLYTCVCDGGFGDRKTTYLKVTEYAAVIVGSRATLDCYSSSDVEWSYKSSKKAQSKNVYSNCFVYDDFKGRFSVPHSSLNFSLVIERVQVNDSGYYTCLKDSGTSSSQHTVLLITSVQAVHGKPEISLQCWPSAENEVDWMVWPLEHFDVLWASKTIYSGGRVYEHFQDRFSVGPSNGSLNNYSLTIKQVQTSDTGVYACIERRGFGDYHYIQLMVTNNTGDARGESMPCVSESGSSNSSNCSNSTTETGCHCKDLTVLVYVLAPLLALGPFVTVIVTVIVMQHRQQQGRMASKVNGSKKCEVEHEIPLRANTPRLSKHEEGFNQLANSFTPQTSVDVEERSNNFCM